MKEIGKSLFDIKNAFLIVSGKQFCLTNFLKTFFCHRDIIICRDSETEVTRFVQQIQKQIVAEYGDKKWLGITSKIY